MQKQLKALLYSLTMFPLFLFSGCAVDNEYIAKLPLFEAKSDKIPGLDPPYERKKLIREKGEKGAKADAASQEILSAQLMLEYQTSPDPNMRREAVDAMAKIPCPQRDQYLLEVLKDSDAFIRLSALEALKTAHSKSSSAAAGGYVSVLVDRMKHDTDKDVRLAAIRLLGGIKLHTIKESEGITPDSLTLALGEMLQDKVPAVRYASMETLQKLTGKDYGTDINRWSQYIRYIQGEDAELPQPRSFAEKIPRIDLPMFK
ncbi:MAG: HEAT repeat domain-containing protein [Planctomycetaceae bacterium]|nr:HEAT repeat domain-containing protein [Planctomycetaceae bacterium]